MPTFSTSFQHCTGDTSFAISQKKKDWKDIKIRKEDMKLLICSWCVISVEKPWKSKEQLLELINEFSDFKGY